MASSPQLPDSQVICAGMGLLSQPPHCQISVPPSEGGLLKATMEDIRAVPISLDASVRAPFATADASFGCNEQRCLVQSERSFM